ncbi:MULTISPECIES: alpha/beta fold hydrolase [unclassified Nocardia]|uniref:alpha/beta fold hydrolase n=1 Tax=unclassified Nocardia TaxID=2637762 RepID=UPI001CE43EF7|nr:MULTISPECIES: alpha/beta hydrolase [unclassified Nocardia]
MNVSGRPRRWIRGMLTFAATAAVFVGAAPAHADEPPAGSAAATWLGGTRYVDTPVARFAYRKSGDGPPIVLLPGGTLWAYTYRDIVPELARQHTVYAVDLPGTGYTSLHDKDFGYSVTEMSDALRQFMDAVGLDHATVLAHSLNGSVAADFAARYPAAVHRLLLIAPLVLDTELNPNLRLMRVPVVGELATALMTRSIFVSNLRAAYTHPERLTDEVADAYWEPLRRVDNQIAMWQQVRGLEPAAVQRELGAITAPTLLLWGEHDTIVPTAQANTVASLIPHPTVRIIADAGHNAHEDDPAAVTAAIQEFVDQSW